MAITWEAAGPAWAPGLTWPVGARVINPPSAGAPPNVYKATVGGTSAASGAGPVGADATPIVDGGVTWLYLGPWSGSVVDVAPELAGEAGAPVMLNIAENMCADLDNWGTLLDDGRRYLAAHFGQLARLRGKGMIVSEGVGPLSRSYASLMGPQVFDLTSAGRTYATLARSTAAVMGSVP